MKAKFLDLTLALALLLIVVSGFAHSWEQAATQPAFGGPIAMSADGRIICAVPSGTYPFISTNSGKSWIASPNSPNLPGVYPGGLAVSADGAKIFAYLKTNLTTTSVFLSTNQGDSWTETGFPSATTSVNYSIACSADGTKVIVGAGNGPLYYSTNSGVNCYTSAAPISISSVASSADGGRMVAAAGGNSLYFSDDFGASWTPGNAPANNKFSVCISSDGKWVGLISGAGSYISGDGGFSWRTNTIAGWTIACSASGADWIVAGEQVYTSTNGGITWTTNLSATQWYTGAVSADGCEMLATGGVPGTWIGRSTPTPQLNIQPQSADIKLTWLTPSTNFVIQRNADLATADWITISNRPTLNFTNLQLEVVIPTSVSNAFFRSMAE